MSTTNSLKSVIIRPRIMTTTPLPSEAINLARQDAINSMCQGEYDTPYYRALAECYLDFKEGKITKEKYEELTGRGM